MGVIVDRDCGSVDCTNTNSLPVAVKVSAGEVTLNASTNVPNVITEDLAVEWRKWDGLCEVVGAEHPVEDVGDPARFLDNHGVDTDVAEITFACEKALAWCSENGWRD